jgi:carbohydrate kinase (thermoresistant glucokinase family)
MSDDATKSVLPPLVVMGVSASGKSSVGRALAEQLSMRFVDADDLHPASNVAKMAAGTPLDDDDRWPWLDVVGSALAADEPTVMACSALARRYRDRIRAKAPRTLFLHLHGNDDVLFARAQARVGHFMPPALLASQLAALEALHSDEGGTVIDIAGSVDEIVAQALYWVRLQHREAPQHGHS